MIKTIIIDDEEDARFMLVNHLQRHFGTEINLVAEANSVKSGIEQIIHFEPDLVFLDIQMGDGSGFDLLEKLPFKNFEVVFVTAYNQYALKAFKFSAIGYLMKPIKVDELLQTVGTITKHFAKYHASAEKRMKVIIENYSNDQKIKKIIIPGSKGFHVVTIEDIIRLEGDRNYTNFITKEKSKIAVAKTLAEYETLLSEYGFFRVHQSSIVNLRHITSYTKGDGGMITLINGDVVQISRHRKSAFLKRFLH